MLISLNDQSKNGLYSSNVNYMTEYMSEIKTKVLEKDIEQPSVI